MAGMKRLDRKVAVITGGVKHAARVMKPQQSGSIIAAFHERT